MEVTAAPSEPTFAHALLQPSFFPTIRIREAIPVSESQGVRAEPKLLRISL